RFPITTLKIDRAFIHDVQSNSKAAEIARAIIGLSKGLELDIVAEGAEVVEHIHFLRAHGCGLVQGFYYSRPLPAKEFEQLVRRGPLRADCASTGMRSAHAALERPEVKA
ncbi:MAG: EAL domain-containing protein, partial [Rhodospirillales bacterium]|nr:EAL domain-containing protein [Rhodospirillales bacterium]